MSVCVRASSQADSGELGGAAFHRAPSVEQVIYLEDAGVAHRGYVVETWAVAHNQLNETLVGSDGKIYAAAMWKVRQNYFAAGQQAVLFDDWIKGLDMTPAAPKPEQMRDGMLQAVAGTGRECLVWKGFAAQGFGVGATGTLSRRGAVTVTESFAVPSSCQ